MEIFLKRSILMALSTMPTTATVHTTPVSYTHLEVYEKWYGCEAVHPELHQRAVYGLPELFREAIRGTDIVGNPGCYPTSVALGLAPALRAGAVETEGLVADAKSGTTGAGRGLAQNTHFPDCNEAFSAYKVAAHRHTPEIEQTLTRVAGKRATVTFVPHLLPVNRGILSTIYARLKPGFSLETVRGLYEDAYRGEPFVRVLPAGADVYKRQSLPGTNREASLTRSWAKGSMINVDTTLNIIWAMLICILGSEVSDSMNGT